MPGIVALSLSKTIKMFPAIGWVRADRASSEELLSEINDLRKQNSQLQSALAELPKSRPAPIPNLAGLDEVIELHGAYYRDGGRRTWKAQATWSELFGFIAPYLIKHPNDATVKGILKDALFAKSGSYGTNAILDDQEFQTVAVQLKALDLIKLSYSKTVQGGMGLFWSATQVGEKFTYELRAVRSTKNV